MLKEIEIGTQLKAIREEKKLSQTEVAQKLTEKNISMSRETLSKIENGNRSISAIELNALCHILNVDISSLFNEDEADDLVTLFRKKDFSEDTIKEIELLQDMIKVFLSSKRLCKEQFKLQKKQPLWKEY